MANMRAERPATVAGDRSKPIGGYTLIPAKAILAAWWAYRADFIEYRDLRVWLACHEAVARRCGLAQGRVPRFTIDELHSLVGGVGGEHLRVSIARLTNAGLLHWSESAIRFGGEEGTLACGHVDALASNIATLENRDRRVPVPRRLLRLMCLTNRPAIVGTMLALILRCSYLRRGCWSGRGRCSSGWAAATFGLDERSVKSARGELHRLKILDREPGDPAWAANRWGAAIVLQPDHALERAEEGSAAASLRSPLDANSTPEPPPPMKTGISVRDGSKNENPAMAPEPLSRDGVRSRTEWGPRPAAPRGPERPDGPVEPKPTRRPRREPTFGHIRIADLRDPRRLDELWRGAVASGLMPGGEASRLRFFAAAARALRVAVRDRAAVFAAIVRKGLWSHIAQHDEDIALTTQAATVRKTIAPVPWEQPTPAFPHTRLRSANGADLESIRQMIDDSLSTCSMDTDGRLRTPAGRGWPLLRDEMSRREDAVSGASVSLLDHRGK